jgi:hypothetical protein
MTCSFNISDGTVFDVKSICCCTTMPVDVPY